MGASHGFEPWLGQPWDGSTFVHTSLMAEWVEWMSH